LLFENEFMSCSTVAEFAYELRKTSETLLGQLKSAGVLKAAASDLITEADKQNLLAFLKASHGIPTDAERKKITLVKKSTIEIKQADATGRARTIEVEVRKKRTFIHHDKGHPAACEQMQHQAEFESVPRSITDRRSAMLDALAHHHQIIRRIAAVVPFEPNEIATAMANAFRGVHSTGMGGMPEGHNMVVFTWPASFHFWVHEQSVQFRRVGACMGRRRRLNGAVSQGFFSPEKLNLRNAP
jgi:hypothetical protein